MSFRIVIEFPALDRFSAAVERYLDMQDGVQQKRIDELTAKLAGSTTGLAVDVAASTPK